ncbi:MAG: hypothetical protein K0Q54_5379, partial [Methylobacterium brachiatum]|nr:hypothetical protein [Methylobacterium brachiatum]
MYLAGIAFTTVIASAATTPFSIYHFSRFPTYGIVTNLIAVPLTGVWIMPWGMLGILLIPLGLGGPCFMLMGHGIEVIIQAAALMAELPGAALAVPRPPLAALVATTLGALWLCLWRTAWRRLGLLGIALGLLLMPAGDPPDLLIDARGEIVAVRLDDGALALSPWRRDGRPRACRPDRSPAIRSAASSSATAAASRSPAGPSARGGLPRGRPRD